MRKEQVNPQIGDIISFGENEWRVLDIQDGKALLLSDKVVEKRAYHQSKTDIIWAECDLRHHLNGEFYDSLGEDKARIAETTVTTNNNPWYGTDGGAKTNDKVFLLSLEEVVKYFGDSGLLKNRPDGAWHINDEYNSTRVATDENGEALWWWLRSPGDYSDYAASVYDNGYVIVDGDDNVAWLDGGVSPALWLNLQSENPQGEPDTVMSDNSSNQEMQDDIKQWYATAYPDDEMGECLKVGNSFRDLFHALVVSQETYEFLGCADSVIRERIFRELSSRMGVGYEDIYALWLKTE